MHEKPRVADVANEVLPRQAVTGDVWMGERFKTAFEAVLETEAGRRLGRLRSTPVPEGWIGRTVELIFVSGSSTEYADGRLEEVNDRGIVLTVEGHGEHPARPLFYPWGAVIQISEAPPSWEAPRAS